jgi:hypothetical protein
MLDACRVCSRHQRAELQIALYLCSPCRTVTTLQLYGKSIAQYMNLSRTGCSKSFSDLHSNVWLKGPTRRAIKSRMRKSTCPWQISRRNTRTTGAPSSGRLHKRSCRRVVDQCFHFAVGISSIFSPTPARIPLTRYSYSFLMKRASE